MRDSLRSACRPTSGFFPARRYRAKPTRLIAAAIGLVLPAISPHSAPAALLTWYGNGSAAGGSGAWSGSNWYNGTSVSTWPTGTGNTAVFGATAGTVTISGTYNDSGLTFNTPGYILSGGTLSLGSGTVFTTSSGTDTLSGTTLTGSGSVTINKTGAGTLALNTSNGNLGTAAAPAVWTINGGTYSSGIFNSVLSISAGNNLGATPTTAAVQVILNAGTLLLSGTGLNPAIGANRIIQVNSLGGAIVDSTGNPYQGAIADNAGSGTSLYLSNTSGTTNISGAISGTGSLTWNGTGTLALTNSTNNYSGGTTINGGALSFAADGDLGTSTVTLAGGTLASTQTAQITFAQTLNTGTTGGTLQLNNGVPTSSANKIVLGTANQITGSGPITVKNNGLLSIDASNSAFTGNWNLNGGVTEIESATALGTGTVTIGSGAELSSLGSQVYNPINLNGGTLSWDYYNSGLYGGAVDLLSSSTVALSDFYTGGTARNGGITGNITGAGSLNITATNAGGTEYGGLLTLSGASNNYSGGTNVGTGTTLALGSGSSIGTGSLSVTGTFNLGGNSLTVPGLTSTGGDFDFTLAANGTPNLLNVGSGGVSLSGTTGISINPSAATSISPGNYTLMTSTAGGLGGSFSFAGGQQLSVPATSAIESIGGTNYRLTLSSTSSVLTMNVAAAPSNIISVMPLGSSITAGQSAQNPYDGGGYRSQLYQDLVNDGRFTPEFVGSSTASLSNNGTGADLMTTVGQSNHEGHPGYTTSQVLGNLNANDGSGGNDGGYWLAPGNGVNPNFITLNIGGNDFVADPTDTTAITRLGEIIDDISQLRPDATIIVSNILYRGDDSGVYGAGVNEYYNPYIPSLVYQHTLEGEHVEFVDMYDLITPNNSLALIGPDLIHPTQTGYNMMADAWYSSMTTGQAFFTGNAGSSWNTTSGNSTSWAMDFQRTTDSGVLPSSNTDVYFNGGSSGTTALGQNFSVRSVNFTAGQTAPINIAGSSTLSIGSGGITVQPGTGAHVISSIVDLATSQTWGNVSSNLFTVSGNVGGTGTLTSTGTGVIRLTGNNTYSGGTFIAAGTLDIRNTAGSGTGSGSVTISAGATLSGNGTVAGATTNSGTIAPSEDGATAASILSLPGGLTNDGNIALDLFAPGQSDELNIGAFNTGIGDIDVASAGTFSYALGQSWDLLDWTSITGSLSTSNVLLPALPNGLTWDTSQLNSGIVDIIPEPASGALAILAGATLLARRRHRQSAVSVAD